ncbi:hypothetical protein UMC2_35431 [[Clostridium] sordellii]|nr:hypothetical protein UMC2_35431 [[Clostridium] sordellii] [Paeniclostridium sordellii]
MRSNDIKPIYIIKAIFYLFMAFLIMTALNMFVILMMG